MGPRNLSWTGASTLFPDPRPCRGGRRLGWSPSRRPGVGCLFHRSGRPERPRGAPPVKYDFDDDLRGPDPSERLHLLVMIGLGGAAALLTAFIFFCFAWSVLTP